MNTAKFKAKYWKTIFNWFREEILSRGIWGVPSRKPKDHGIHYGPDWERQKRVVKERDNHRCQICGRTPDQFKGSLQVHHITPFRDFDDYLSANHTNNLITLCPSCHGKVEAMRRNPMVFALLKRQIQKQRLQQFV